MFSRFRQVWAVDFEYGIRAEDGRPVVRCMCARELFSGEAIQLWEEEVIGRASAQFPTDEHTLVVAHSAMAEVGCFIELGWPVPRCLMDTMLEFKAIRNGYAEYDHKVLRKPKQRFSLVDMLIYYGLPHIDIVEKKEMQQLALRGGPWAAGERAELLAYCLSDCDALITLLLRMEPDLRQFKWHEILHRGRYAIALTRMRNVGVPIDVPMHAAIRESRKAISRRITQAAVADGCDVFESGALNHAKLKAWTRTHNINWPMAGKGRTLSIAGKTFSAFAKKRNDDGTLRYPMVARLWGYLQARDQLSDFELPCDPDGRHRPKFLNPFATITGRQMPGDSIFALPAWLRYLIKPPEGYGVAYLDFSSQEFAIAAAVSGDPTMLADYESGDPYITQAIRTGKAPPNSTKKTHPRIRERFKVAALSILYGQGALNLAARLRVSVREAEEILYAHEAAYPVFHRWRQALLNRHAVPQVERTPLGWPWWSGGRLNPRTLMDFPAQAIGADITRLAIILATESGIDVGASAHDGLLIVAPLDRLDADIERMRRFMQAASQRILGITIRAGLEWTVRYPHRVEAARRDKPQVEGTWNLVNRELRRLSRHPEQIQGGANDQHEAA